MNFNYYYNRTPTGDYWRNNLIYTSLISDDKKTFIQWYYNDKVYHGDNNQVVDPDKMEEKWNREVTFLKLMVKNYPNLVPNVLDIDYKNRKIYHSIDGDDFWQLSLDNKKLNLHKYSMHPSSYFVVNGKLKSINYFFTYHKTEPNISIQDVESHIYVTRQDEMKKYLLTLGIEWNIPQTWDVMDKLCWNSFRKNYPEDFIEKALNV